MFGFLKKLFGGGKSPASTTTSTKTTPQQLQQIQGINPADYRNSFVVGTAAVTDQQGRQTRRPVAIHPNAGSLTQHGNVMVCGMPGSGKGRLITANLLSWGHSAVVVDLKGETYRRTANARKAADNGKGRVIVLDSVNATGHRYDPLAVIDKDQRYELAAELISVTNDDAFWAATANDMWQACWSAADHAQKPHMTYAVEIMKLDIVDAMRYLFHHHGQDAETMQHLTNFFGRRLSDDAAEKMDAEGPSKLLESMWKTVKTTMSIFNDPKLLKIFNGHDFDPGGMFYNGEITTVYVVADEKKPIVFEPFSRLVLKSLGDSLIREGDRQDTQRRPVMFLLDEFGAVRLNSVFGWKNTMRSRDVFLVVFVQDLDQFSAKGVNKYDDHNDNSFHHWILFKPPRFPSRVSKLISEMSGKTTVAVQGGAGFSLSDEGGYTRNQSVTYTERHVLEQEQMEDWSSDMAYVSLTQARTEKYVVHVANNDRLGWRLPPAADLPPPLPPYVSPLLPMPDRATTDTSTAAMVRQVMQASGSGLTEEDDPFSAALLDKLS